MPCFGGVRGSCERGVCGGTICCETVMKYLEIRGLLLGSSGSLIPSVFRPLNMLVPPVFSVVPGRGKRGPPIVLPI